MDYNGSAGVQHIALNSCDIITAVSRDPSYLSHALAMCMHAATDY